LVSGGHSLTFSNKGQKFKHAKLNLTHMPVGVFPAR